jgi:hypothetical protein
LDEKENTKEVPRVQRYAARPLLRELFKGKKGRIKKLRIRLFMLLMFAMVIP